MNLEGKALSLCAMMLKTLKRRSVLLTSSLSSPKVPFASLMMSRTLKGKTTLFRPEVH